MVGRVLGKLSSSVLKSLLQKLIRFAPLTLVVEGSSVPLAQAVERTFFALLAAPGCFVPNIRRYVSGVEAALKRLGVIMLEDGCVVGREGELNALFAGALLAQRVPGWRPTEAMARAWASVAVACASDLRAMHFSIEAGLKLTPFTVSEGHSAMKNASAMLDSLCSFPGDLAIARYLASVSCPRTVEATQAQRPQSMPIHHCLDMHCTTGVSWTMPAALVQAGYPTFFRKLFKLCTGHNPRRVGAFNEDAPFSAQVRTAQAIAFAHMTPPHVERPTLSVATMHYKLHVSSIAAMIGPAVS